MATDAWGLREGGPDVRSGNSLAHVTPADYQADGGDRGVEELDRAEHRQLFLRQRVWREPG
jgi:hypothetical protein